jgi:DNA-binding protein H-NS
MNETNYELDCARSLWAQAAEAASSVLRKLSRLEKKVLKLSGKESSDVLGEIELLRAQYKVLSTINHTRWQQYKDVEAATNGRAP